MKPVFCENGVRRGMYSIIHKRHVAKLLCPRESLDAIIHYREILLESKDLHYPVHQLRVFKEETNLYF